MTDLEYTALLQAREQLAALTAERDRLRDEVAAVTARVAELEGALRSAALEIHIRMHTGTQLVGCDKAPCLSYRAALEGTR